MLRFLRTDKFLLVAIILLTTLIALPVLTYPLGRDQGEFATIGRGILDGRVPYRDLWNPKPPAVFYVYSLAMTVFGRSTVSLRAIDLLIVPFISLALYWLGKQIDNRRVGLWAALLFPVFYFTETFWTLTQNDGIVLLPMTLAMVCVFKAVTSYQLPVASYELPVEKPESSNLATQNSLSPQSLVLRPVIYGFLAGALGAYVVWFKYPFAAFVALEIIAFLLLRQSAIPSNTALWQRIRLLFSPQSLVLSPVFAFFLGLLIVGGGGALYLASIGAWDDLLQSAQVTAQYTALTFNLQDFGVLLVTALGYRWAQWGLLLVLAGGGLIFWLLRKLRDAGWTVVALWLLAGLAIMLVQAKAYDYHWLPMLPLLVLFAALSLDRLFHALANRFAFFSTQSSVLNPQSVLTAILLLVLMLTSIWPKVWPYLTGTEDQTAYYARFVSGAAEEFRADESLRVANLLRERVAPGDTLFIWGFRPEVYFMSQLNPGSRFIFQFPLVGSWYPPKWRDEAVDTLWASMPPYALVLQVDYMPWVTGSHEDSNTLLQGYTEMNNWLIANYERDTQIGNFFIWRRKS
jgi:4-amino-4-deoxy-L-arabinose transferase-like glycosyltransferase